MTRPTIPVSEWNRTKDRLAAELYSPLHVEILRRNNASAVAAARAFDRLGEQVTAEALCRVPPASRFGER